MGDINWQKCDTCKGTPSSFPSCPFVQPLNLQWYDIERLQCQFIDFLLMTGFVLATSRGLHKIEEFAIIHPDMENLIELMRKHGYDRASYDALVQRYSNYLWTIRDALIANHPKQKAERLHLLTQQASTTAK